MNNVLVIDVGGTEIKHGIISGQKLENIESTPTNVKRQNFSVIEILENIIDNRLQKQSISGIAISTAGVVDSDNGKIVYANQNLPNYTGTEITKILTARYNLPCTVENDVNCAALGEHRVQGIDNFVMITIGTGLGGAIVINGKIYKGSKGSAGEIGYTIQNGVNIESLVSTSALIASVPGSMNGKEIFERAKQDDIIAIMAIEALCDNLAQALNNIASLMNPQAIILGGGIMEQSLYLNPIIKKYFKKYANPVVFESTEVRFATLGNRAGMIGAYEHFMQAKDSSRTILDIIKGGLVVSCQALDHEPLHSSYIMGRMALAAKEAGAVGIRAQGVEDILEIKKQVSLPVIGIIKRNYSDSDIYITATQKEVRELLATGCEMIALDATSRRRPNDERLRDLLNLIHDKGCLAMADCSTFEECIVAQEIGFDCVSTTLCGYTTYSTQIEGPNLELMEKLVKVLKIPLIAEGKIHTPEDLIKVYETGVHSAVVGGAITRPQEITSRFIKELQRD